MGSTSSLTQQDYKYVLRIQSSEASIRKREQAKPTPDSKAEPTSMRKRGTKVIPVTSPSPLIDSMGPNSSRRQPLTSRLISSDGHAPLSARDRGGGGALSARAGGTASPLSGGGGTSKRIVVKDKPDGPPNIGHNHTAELGAKYSFSPKCPWLVKTADLSKSTFKDFDYLRVIGQGLMGKLPSFSSSSLPSLSS